MSKTLSTEVDRWTQGSTVAEVPMVTVTVIEDHALQTLSTPITFTTHPTQRVLEVDEPEVPFLFEVAYPRDRINHLPSPVGGGDPGEFFARQIRFSLMEPEYEGGSLLDFLTADGELDRSLVTLRSLVVPPSEMGTDPRHRNFIHGDFTNGDVLTWFEGTILRVLNTAPISAIAGPEPVRVPWKYVPDDGSDPIDRGVALPIPLGQNALIKCVNLIVGTQTALQTRLSIGETEARVFDASQLSAPGTVMIGAEAVDFATIDGNALKGLTRGAFGTTESDHVFGKGVIESEDIILGIADRTISAVTKLFIVVANNTVQTIEVPNLIYSVNYNDEDTLPGSSGDPITTVTMSGAQLSVLTNTMIADGAVIQQAIYIESGGSSPPQDVATDSPPFADGVLVDQGTGATGTWATVTTTPTWTYSKSETLQQGLQLAFDGLSENPAKGLRGVQFGFTVDVDTITSGIGLGLIATGLEGVAVGFVDGTLVAQLDIATTGIHSVVGTLFVTSVGSDIVDLEGVVLSLIKSEVSGGNPSIVFEVTAVDMTYGFVNDIIEETVLLYPDTLFNNVTGGANQWEQDWTLSPLSQNLGTDRNQGVTAFLDWTIDPGPVPATPIKEAAFFFDTITNDTDDNGTTDDNNCRLSFGNNWETGLLTTKPTDRVNTHSGNETISKTIGLTGSLQPGATTADIGVGLTVTLVTEGDDQAATAAIFAGNDDPGPPDNPPNFGLQITYDKKDPTFTQIEQLADAQIQAGTGGIGLRFFAQVDGPEAPDIRYIASVGNLMTQPADLAQYWLREVGGFSAADVDSLGSFLDTETILDDYRFGFDARNLGRDFPGILGRIGYEARANITRSSGEPWKMLIADGSYEFPAPTLTVDSLELFSLESKDFDAIKTRLQVFYGFDPRRDEASVADFLNVLSTDPTDLDVVAREEQYGRQDADPRDLFCHTTDGLLGVADWLGYFEQELGRPARLAACRIDTWQGYALEVGDLRTVVHPRLDDGAGVKMRVIEFERNQTRGLLVRFVEVL